MRTVEARYRAAKDRMIGNGDARMCMCCAMCRFMPENRMCASS